MAKETVLVVGASGIIGVSIIIGALRSGRNVLAVVRSKESAEKMFKHVGRKDGITTVEVDVTSESGLQNVVDLVRAGRLPKFQHVYSTVAAMVPTSPIWKVDTASYHYAIRVAVDTQFFAYRATVPYLIQQGCPESTWTMMTGAGGDLGYFGVSSIGQGALFALATVASRENESTNVHFNEVNLGFRVNFDTDPEGEWTEVMSAREFSGHYEKVLDRQDIRGARISMLGWEDVENLKFKKKV